MAIDLESIINEVRRYATSNIGGMGQTAAQGRALLGLSELVGGMQQSQDKITSAEKLGMLGMQNEIERQRIASTPGIMEAERKNRVPGFGILGQGQEDNSSSGNDWWKSNNWSQWFK